MPKICLMIIKTYNALWHFWAMCSCHFKAFSTKRPTSSCFVMSFSLSLAWKYSHDFPTGRSIYQRWETYCCQNTRERFCQYPTAWLIGHNLCKPIWHHLRTANRRWTRNSLQSRLLIPRIVKAIRAIIEGYHWLRDGSRERIPYFHSKYLFL